MGKALGMSNNSQLVLSLLGKPSVSLDNSPAPSLGTTKTQALFFFLATTGETHSRQDLAQLLWPADSDEKAKNSLRVALTRLRKVVPNHLDVERQSVSFNWDSSHLLDIHTFDTIAASLRKAIENRQPVDIDSLLGALLLYKGAFLEDFHIDGAPAFETWLLNEREHRSQAITEILHVASELLLQARRYDDAQRVLARQLEFTPWEEDVHLGLMKTYSRLGDFNRALSQYQICVEVLAEELDAEPSDETTALYRRIQAARSVNRDNLPVDPTPFVGRAHELARLHTMLTANDCRLVTVAGMGGIGKTRLALAAAREVCQEEALFFLNGVFYISLSSTQASTLFPAALARGLGLDVGSADDPLTSVIDYLENKEMLLVLDGFDNLVRDSIQLQDQQGQPASAWDESAIGTLNLILEDCPDVRCLVTSREPLDLDIEWRFELFGLDYPSSPSVPNIDQYSAVQLFYQGATQVRPGYQPTAGELPHIVELCQLLGGMPLGIKLSAAWLRAMSTARIVEEISQNLDFLSTRMRDIDPRQRSMRAVLDYTWALLTENEKVGLASLAIFEGSFTADAASEVAGISRATLDSIIGHSLVQLQTLSTTDHIASRGRPVDVYPEYESYSSPSLSPSVPSTLSLSASQTESDAENSGYAVRYTIHQMVRQYASEKLSQDPERLQIVGDRHCRYYVDFLQKQVDLFSGTDELIATGAIARERPNIRGAWRWSLDNFDPVALESILYGESLYFQNVGPFQQAEAICQLMADRLRQYMSDEAIDLALGQKILGRVLVEQVRFLNLLGRYESVLALVEQIFAINESHDDPLIDIPARYFRVRALAYLGDIDQSYEEARDCLELAELAQMRVYEANCLSMIGFVYLQRNNYTQANQAYEAGLEISRTLNDRVAESSNLNNLGVIAVQLGDYKNAQIYYEQALNLSVETGNRQGEGQRLNNLARVYSEQRRYSTAAAHLRHALHITRSIGDRLVESNTLISMGRNSLYLGDYESAAAQFDEALAIKREMMEGYGESEALTYQGLLHYLKGEYRVSLERSRAGLNRARETNSAFILYFALNNIGHALVGLNRLAEAKQTYEQALAGRLELAHRNLSTEPMAGLVSIALRRRDIEMLRQYAEPLLEHLAEGNVHGTDQPFRVSWMAYLAQRQLAPDQASFWLDKIQAEFQETLEQIHEPELREMFRHNVAVHQEIMNAENG